MSACRETANIWWVVFGKTAVVSVSVEDGVVRRRDFIGGIKKVIERRLWRSSYFWQDSFVTHWNRLVGCRLLGHRKVENVGFTDEPELTCFNCHRKLGQDEEKISSKKSHKD